METFERQAASNLCGLQIAKTLFVALDIYERIAKQTGDLELRFGERCRIVFDVPIPIEFLPADMPQTGTARLVAKNALTMEDVSSTFELSLVTHEISHQVPGCPAGNPATARYVGAILTSDILGVIPEGAKRGKIKLEISLKDGLTLAEIGGHIYRTPEYDDAERPLSTRELLDEHKNDDTRHLTQADRETIDNCVTTGNVDQTYSATSTNPQSGVAVAQAVAEAGGGDCNVTITDNGSIACGEGATVSSTSVTVAIGPSAKASGNYSTALGYNAQASSYATALGYNALASGSESTALGFNANANNSYATALGTSAQASGAASTALGNSAQATGLYSTALGTSAQASGNSSTALGPSAKASGNSSTALGYIAQASGNSTALGYNAKASGNSSTALGYNAQATGSDSTALGYSAYANDYYSTAVGYNANASFNSTALGYNSKAFNKYSSALGSYAYCQDENTVAFGAGQVNDDGYYRQFYLGIDSSGNPFMGFAKLDILNASVAESYKIPFSALTHESWAPTLTVDEYS